MQRLIRLISTFFYLGYSPFAPGTIGSFGAVFLWWLAKDNPIAYSGLILAVIGLGFLVSGRAERLFGQKDSRRIVIDEVGGLLVAFFLVPFGVRSFLRYPILHGLGPQLVIGFLLYRALDILKPYPIRRLQNLSGSAGVMLDDLVAGLYTNLLLQIAIRT